MKKTQTLSQHSNQDTKRHVVFWGLFDYLWRNFLYTSSTVYINEFQYILLERRLKAKTNEMQKSFQNPVKGQNDVTYSSQMFDCVLRFCSTLIHFWNTLAHSFTKKHTSPKLLSQMFGNYHIEHLWTLFLQLHDILLKKLLWLGHCYRLANYYKITIEPLRKS